MAPQLDNYHKDRYTEYNVLREDTFHLFKVYDMIKDLRKKVKLEKVLEIGCSDCTFAAKLKKDFGFDMHGMDLTNYAMQACKEKGIKGILHNLENKMPIEDNTFDLVIICEVIEHIFDTDYVIREIHRILKKDGHIIITAPNINSLTNRIAILLGKYPNSVEYRATKEGSGHIRVYNFKALKNQLKENRFSIKKVTSPNFPFPVKNKRIPLKLRMMMLKFGDIAPTLSNEIVILARKI